MIAAYTPSLQLGFVAEELGLESEEEVRLNGCFLRPHWVLGLSRSFRTAVGDDADWGRVRLQATGFAEEAGCVFDASRSLIDTKLSRQGLFGPRGPAARARSR
jgi:hypothetical protein